MTPISLGIFASANQGSAANSFESIATVSVGSGGSSSIDFTSIPGTYSHLQIRGIARTNRSDANFDALLITFNSDTGSNYSDHYLFGDGSAAYADGTANRASIRLYYATTGNATASVFGASIVDILDYSNTNKYKTTRTLIGYDLNGSGTITLNSGSWRSTNAITSIQIKPNSGTSFNQYSHFALYGIKAPA